MKITFPTQDDLGCSKVMDVLKGFNSKFRYFVPSKTQVVG
jgi:hypothetical protein